MFFLAPWYSYVPGRLDENLTFFWGLGLMFESYVAKTFVLFSTPTLKMTLSVIQIETSAKMYMYTPFLVGLN